MDSELSVLKTRFEASEEDLAEARDQIRGAEAELVETSRQLANIREVNTK